MAINTRAYKIINGAFIPLINGRVLKRFTDLML